MVLVDLLQFFIAERHVSEEEHYYLSDTTLFFLSLIALDDDFLTAQTIFTDQIL